VFRSDPVRKDFAPVSIISQKRVERAKVVVGVDGSYGMKIRINSAVHIGLLRDL
jgi:hypothetical protein